MRSMLKTCLSDYLTVELAAVILAAFIVASVTAYISANSVYRASVMGGTVTPILGAPGELSSKASTKPPTYYIRRYEDIKDTVAKIFGELVWSSSGLISAVYSAAIIIALFPFLYRFRTSFVPLLFRERSNPVSLTLKGLILSLFFILPLFLASAFPMLWVSERWLSGTGPSLLLLTGALLSLLLMLAVALYSMYTLWGRLDLALIFTLFLAFGLSGKLGLEWKTIFINVGVSVALVIFIIIASERRWMSV